MNYEQYKSVVFWLFSILLLLLSMIILGGFTRLTGSGLSMVDWHPITGWLPPLNEVAWDRVFADYKRSPEYLKTNIGMTNIEFKSIFWLEYLHRLLGRIIGVVFFIPMIVFIFRGWIKGGLRGSLNQIGPRLTGGLRGFPVGSLKSQGQLVSRPPFYSR